MGFLTLPAGSAFRLAGATVPASAVPGMAADAEGFAAVDIDIADGRIAAVAPAGATAAVLPAVALKRAMVWPGFVDAHTHLDKGHIWPRQPNPDGTFTGALAAVEQDRRTRWTAADVRARMEFALACALAHGTVAMRTHLDSLEPQTAISWEVFGAVREAWADRITLQAVSLTPVDKVLIDAEYVPMRDAVRRHAGVLGAVAYPGAALLPAVRRMVADAERFGLGLDFHADETQDPASNALEAIADVVLETGFQGPVMVGHCCSLANQDAATADRVMDKVARAGLSIVSLPLCNLYLQARQPGFTPRARGVTLLRELARRGVNVLIASDNTRDPFYAYGDHDMLEVLREGVRIAHLDHPFDLAAAMVGTNPAAAMGLAGRGLIAAGAVADLVVVRARSLTELLARPWSDRTVVRAGRAIDATPPDYSTLDPILEGLPA